MNLEFDDDNFRLKEQEINERKLNLMDLQLEFQEFANDLNGKFLCSGAPYIMSYFPY